MMKEIRFWDEADECVEVNGLYIHPVDDSVVDIYLQSVLPEAIRKGALYVMIDFAEYDINDYFLNHDDTEEDEYETVDDDYTGNMHCDTYGVCGGWSCPNYKACKGV